MDDLEKTNPGFPAEKAPAGLKGGREALNLRIGDAVYANDPKTAVVKEYRLIKIMNPEKNDPDQDMILGLIPWEEGEFKGTDMEDEQNTIYVRAEKVKSVTYERVSPPVFQQEIPESNIIIPTVTRDVYDQMTEEEKRKLGDSIQ